MTRSVRPLLLAAAVLTLGACLDTIQPARERTGFISVPALRDSAGNVFLRPIAAFYKYDGLELNNFSGDSCWFASYTVNAPSVANLPTIGAGDFLITNVPGRQDTLFISTVLGGLQTYQLLTRPYITYTPGDTITLTVPGELGGFPASELRVRTAEAFTFNDPDTASRNVPMPLTWTTAVAPGSRFQVSLRFAGSNASSNADTQLYCDLVDDGAYTVPAFGADVFRNSQYQFRSWAATRQRWSRIEHGDFTQAFLISMYDQPLGIYTPPL